MAKGTSTSTPSISDLVERDPPIGGVLSTPDDFWIDTKYYFIRKSRAVEQTWYYRSLKYSYEHRHPNGKPGPYNKAEFDRVFGGLVIGKSPYPLKEKFSKLPPIEMDRAVRAPFHLDPEIEWRWPEPGERIYDRPVDGFLVFGLNM